MSFGEKYWEVGRFFRKRDSCACTELRKWLLEYLEASWDSWFDDEVSRDTLLTFKGLVFCPMIGSGLFADP